MGTWRALHPRRILHAPGAISVHVGASPDESRTRALRSGAECSSDLPTAELKKNGGISDFCSSYVLIRQEYFRVHNNNFIFHFTWLKHHFERN